METSPTLGRSRGRPSCCTRVQRVYSCANASANFPNPIRLGGCTVGWLTYEVDEWLARQIEVSRGISK
ncbi:MAG: AlpA family phage regulatory protein [Proteobacteria bacterium]|nr:AlpA family phage regulatory protein [Pseudomonadota bacterium]